MKLLSTAQDWVQSNSLGLSDRLKQALISRIELRACILAAVDVKHAMDIERAREWERCIGLLSALKQTRRFGKPVKNSFSVKMQRKLASTVPPRPIVDVTFDNALDLLDRICGCGRDAYRILEYHGGSQLQVRCIRYVLGNS